MEKSDGAEHSHDAILYIILDFQLPKKTQQDSSVYWV